MIWGPGMSDDNSTLRLGEQDVTKTTHDKQGYLVSDEYIDPDGYIGYSDVQTATARTMRWQAWKRASTFAQQMEASVGV